MHRLCLVACISIPLLSMSAAAQEAAAPVVGQKATYDCEGAFGGTYVYEVKSLEDGTIGYDLTAPNGNRRTLVMPVWALGTSLYQKDYGEGYGRGEMTSGLDKFEGLKPLATGTEISGTVKEKASGAPARTWTYTVKVVERKPARSDVLGDVEIVVIREHRSTSGISSDREAHVVPALSELIYTHYSDSSGKKRDCRLAGFERP